MTDVDLVVAQIRLLPNWPKLSVPDGYADSMALCVMDAIWSMGIRYSAVEKLIGRYCKWLQKNARGSTATRSLDELIGDIEFAGGPEQFAGSAVKNRSRTSSRNGILKAEAVLDASRILSSKGVNHPKDLQERHDDPELKRLWCEVRGQSSGISWHYLLILAGVEDVKADRMIVRFVERAVGRSPVSPIDAYDLVLAAHGHLSEEIPSLSLRSLDHTIWSAQRGRQR